MKVSVVAAVDVVVVATVAIFGGGDLKEESLGAGFKVLKSVGNEALMP